MYRSIETAMWDDPWFAELPPNAKLLFIYLITNRRATAAGVFEIQRRALVFETGLSGDAVKEAIDALAAKVTWWGDHQVIWVHNFYWRQRANTGPSFTVSARNALATFPPDVRAVVLATYPELGPTSNDPTPTPPKDKTTVETPPAHPNGRVATPTVQATDTVPIATGHRLTVTETEEGTEAETEERVETRADAPRIHAPPKKPKKRSPIPIPDPFVVDEAMVAWALAEGMSAEFIRSGTTYFVDWAQSHDHRYADWPAVWRNVMRSRWHEGGGKVVHLRRA